MGFHRVHGSTTIELVCSASDGVGCAGMDNDHRVNSLTGKGNITRVGSVAIGYSEGTRQFEMARLALVDPEDESGDTEVAEAVLLRDGSVLQTITGIGQDVYEAAERAMAHLMRHSTHIEAISDPTLVERQPYTFLVMSVALRAMEATGVTYADAE